MPRRRVALLRRPNVSGPGAPAPQLFTPADLPGLVTWLEPTAQGTLRGDPTGTYTGALDDGPAIGTALDVSEARLSQWNGSGGTGNFTQATEAAQPWWLQGQISAFPAADFRDGQVMLSVANGATFWPAAQTTVAELAVVVKAVGAWAQGHILSLNQADATNALQIRVTTSIQWAYRNTSNALTAIGAPLPSVDEPHELRLVKTAGSIFGFIDGVEVASASDARGPIFASGGAVPITLGGRSDLTNGFDGAISEVIARNVVLTPQQRLRESNYLQIKYSAPSPVDAPAFTDGTLFSDGTGFTDTPQTTPTIAVSQITTGPGGTVQVVVANGPGRVLDWVGLFLQEATSPDNRLAWQYLNGTQTPPSIPIRSATLSFTMPFVPGQYVFRFYTTVGAQHTLLASSNVVAVQEVTGRVYEPGVYDPGIYEGSALEEPVLVTRGLLHEYRFDEGSGQALTDYHGTADGQLGATTGAEASDPAWTAAGLSFNGTTTYVLTPDATNISDRSTWTLCVMLKGAAQTDRRFYSEGSTVSGNQVGLFASGNSSNTSRARVFFRDSANIQQIDWTPASTVFDNTWRFISFKRNGTSISFCNNGTFITDTIGSGVMDVALNRTVIGALSPTSSWWAGEIGWIAKYDVDLSDAEILDNQGYAQGLMDGRTPDLPVNTVLPSITGDLIVGEVLTCSTGTWTHFPDTYSYQWKLDGSNVGTNQNTYLTAATGVYTCVVIATNALGSSDPATAGAVTVTAGVDAIIAGVNLASAEFGVVPGTYGSDYFYPPTESVDYFLDRGFARLRVPFRWERLQPTLNGSLDATELGRLTTLINYIADQGGQPIVDPHNYAGYTLAGTNHKIGSASVTIAHYRDFWERLATVFAADSRIIFCLMNEPTGIAIATWMNAANQAIQGIRGIGATSQIIQVQGVGFTAVHTFLSLDAGEEFLAQVTDPNDNLEIEVHMYLDSDNVGDSADVSSDVVGPIRMGHFTQWCRRRGFKAHLGEWNGGDNSSSVNSTQLQAVREVHDYLARNQDVWRGYTMWAGGPWWAESYLHDLEPIGGPGGATPRLRISELQARSSLKVRSYPTAILAFDFAFADYQGATLGSVLSLAQAGSTLKLDPTTGAFSIVSANTLRIVPRWGLLTEEARSNYSPHIMTPSSLINLTSTGGQAAPDGTTDAVRLLENTALGAHITTHDNTVTDRTGLTAGDWLTVSAWAKLITGQAERWAWCYWGTPDSNATQGLRLRSWGAESMVAGVGDWFRVSRSFQCTGVGSLIKFGLQPDASPGAAHTADSYTGNGASGIHWWGVQVEKGGFPTLPIKNTNLTTKMDRAADELSLTGLALSTIQGDFTLVLETMYVPEHTGQAYTLLRLNSTVALRINGNRTVGGDVGVSQATGVAGTGAAFTQPRKVAISVRRSAGRIVIAAEGSAGAVVGADVTVPATTSANLGPLNGYIRSMQLYGTFHDTTALTALVRG